MGGFLGRISRAGGGRMFRSRWGRQQWGQRTVLRGVVRLVTVSVGGQGGCILPYHIGSVEGGVQHIPCFPLSLMVATKYCIVCQPTGLETESPHTLRRKLPMCKVSPLPAALHCSGAGQGALGGPLVFRLRPRYREADPSFL